MKNSAPRLVTTSQIATSTTPETHLQSSPLSLVSTSSIEAAPNEEVTRNKREMEPESQSGRRETDFYLHAGFVWLSISISS